MSLPDWPVEQSGFQYSVSAAPFDFAYLREPLGWRKNPRLVVFLHGAGGENFALLDHYAGGYPNLWAKVFRPLLNAGYSLAAPAYGQAGANYPQGTFGNDFSLARLDDFVAAMVARGYSLPFSWVGMSMGSSSAFLYASLHPTYFRSLVQLLPVGDLQVAYDANPGTVGSWIEAAYSPSSWAANKDAKNPTSSSVYPSVKAASLPVRAYFADDDTTAPPSGAQALQQLVGARQYRLVSMGSGGHTDAPMARIDSTALTAFVRSYHP